MSAPLVEILRLRHALQRVANGEKEMSLSWARAVALDALAGCDGSCYPGECKCHSNAALEAAANKREAP